MHFNRKSCRKYAHKICLETKLVDIYMKNMILTWGQEEYWKQNVEDDIQSTNRKTSHPSCFIIHLLIAMRGGSYIHT